MRVCLIVLGCPKNVVEGEGIAALVRQAGHELTTDLKSAEAAIVHTCCFVNDAKDESWGCINRLISQKISGSLSKIIICGCMAQELGRNLRKLAPEIDVILGTGQLHRIANMLGRSAPFVECEKAGGLLEPKCGRILSSMLPSAYIRIAEGCNHKCAFCVIPKLRGGYRSRTTAAIIREAEALAGAGIAELNIAAQDTTVFGRERTGRLLLADLLGKINAISGLRWIRLMYAYPNTVTGNLLDAIRDLPKVCKYIDIPLQHVSVSVLRRMGRPADVRGIVERIVQKIPQISIRTAFITGFPGETERDFNELCNFVKEGWFEHVGVFEYSDNAKARSHWLRPSVPAKLASLRRRELMLVQNNIVKNRNRARIGLKFDVLIEKPIEGKIDTWQGRASFQAPEVDSTIECKCPPLRAVAGQFVKARVLSLRGLNLVGEII